MGCVFGEEKTNDGQVIGYESSQVLFWLLNFFSVFSINRLKSEHPIFQKCSNKNQFFHQSQALEKFKKCKITEVVFFCNRFYFIINSFPLNLSFSFLLGNNFPQYSQKFVIKRNTLTGYQLLSINSKTDFSYSYLFISFYVTNFFKYIYTYLCNQTRGQ